MTHIIEIEDLTGEYNNLIASSSKEQKKLFITTITDKEGNAETTFDVFSGVTKFRYKDMKIAIKHYNQL